jgi:GNAT superfamily N-acetyltransferase
MAGFIAIEIRAAPLEQIIDLRHRVLREGLPRETAFFTGDDQPGAIHLAAIFDHQTIGCATLHPSDYEGRPAFQLRGMAIEPAHQRHGIGRRLLLKTHRLAVESRTPVLWANCRTPAVSFYKSFGWKVISQEFVIETAGPHFKMIKFMRA